jgi:hypothetical protein
VQHTNLRDGHFELASAKLGSSAAPALSAIIGAKGGLSIDSGSRGQLARKAVAP